MLILNKDDIEFVTEFPCFWETHVQMSRAWERDHSVSKVASSHTKVDENFANLVVERESLDKYFSFLTCIQGYNARKGKLLQKCMHLLYCSVVFLGGNVNTRKMSKPDMGSIFHIKNQ